ncbi:MAG: hypothetical protein GC162_19395 [Planctomycetes bacterium]|nr:hypothetical protein [Planctomycetota bacterium]
MTQAAFGGVAFSTDVELWLECGAARIPLTQVAPTFVRTDHPRDLPAGRATIIISVDGQIQSVPVILCNGMKSSDGETTIRPNDAVPF